MLFAADVGMEMMIATLQDTRITSVRTERWARTQRKTYRSTSCSESLRALRKTTATRKMGKCSNDIGFLSEATVEECSATAITEKYVGQTDPKV